MLFFAAGFVINESPFLQCIGSLKCKTKMLFVLKIFFRSLFFGLILPMNFHQILCSLNCARKKNQDEIHNDTYH